jgi:uncharacterized delta-60 repeat protein
MPTRSNLTRIVVAALACLFCYSFAYSQLDPAFGNGGTTLVHTDVDDRPIGAFLLPDGKILVVNGSNNTNVGQFVRLNPDGTVDTSYGTGGRLTLPIPFISNGYLYKAIRQTDGKIVVVGTDNSDGLIMRFNEDGTFDTSFSDDGIHRPNINQLGFDGLSDVVQQSDGKLVAIGDAGSSLGRVSAIRYLPNGEPDTTFGDHKGYVVIDTGFNAFYQPTVALQSTGKLVIFYNGGGFEPADVFRLTADGALDSSFPSLRPPREATVLRVISNDRIVIGGYEPRTDSLRRTNTDMVIRRYSADGQLDLTFGTNGVADVDVTSKFSDEVFDIVERNDGHLIIGGTTGVPPNRSNIDGVQISLVTLTPDGTKEGSFLVAEATDVLYGRLLLQPDGKIVTVSTKFITAQGTDLLITRSLGVPAVLYRFHGIPFELTYDLGHSDAALFRPSTSRWYTTPGTIDSIFFGLPDDILVPSDYLGSDILSTLALNSDVAVFRPSSGTWYIGRDYNDPAHNFVAVQWGANGDIPAPADYDGDGKSDLAVFRPSSGIWYIKNIGDGSTWARQWGLEGDKPVVGDYDGDGIYDIAVWRPSDGFWYIIRSSDQQAMYVPFGLSGDIPVQEDYDGDGKFDIAVFRPSDGFWYILRSSDGGITYANWGLSTDVAVPADYDGDHRTDIAVWRPSSRTWYIKYSSGRPTDPFIFGSPGDIPVAARH